MMRYKYIRIITYMSLLLMVGCSVLIISRSNAVEVDARTGSKVGIDSTRVGSPNFDLSGDKTKNKDSIN